MEQQQTESSSVTVEKKPLRPVLIGSQDAIAEYALFLHHLLVGLADELICSGLVCHPDCDVNAVVSPTVEVIRHPALDLPLAGHHNKKILIEKLKKFNPTVLHCLSEDQAQLTRQLSLKLGLPYILTINSLQKRFSQLSISPRRLAKIIVPAKSIAANVAEVYPKFADRIEQVSMGTFTEEASMCFSDPNRLPSMVTVHPFYDACEFENLLGAIKHLVVDGYEFMLVMIGQGRAESQVRKLLGTLGLSQVVSIIPRLEPWRSVLAAGDIFIQPKPTNAFNPVVLEAMSVGTVVAGCRGGVDDLIIDEQTCVVFNPDDKLSIYSTLKRLFDGREFTRQLARQAQEYLRTNHSVSKMVSAVLNAYSLAPDWFKSQRSS